MLKLSAWARRNPWKTRMINAALHLFLIVLGIILGKNLTALGVDISTFLLALATVLFLFAVTRYPFKKPGRRDPLTWHFYYRQKFSDGMLAFSTFLLCAYISHTPSAPFVFSSNIQSASLASVPATASPSMIPVKETKKSKVRLNYTKAERKALLKELKKVLKESLRQEKDPRKNNATRITQVVLTIAGGVLLTLLLAALACSIACNGAETAAVLVLIFGIAALAALMIVVLRAIMRKYPRQAPPASDGGIT